MNVTFQVFISCTLFYITMFVCLDLYHVYYFANVSLHYYELLQIIRSYKSSINQSSCDPFVVYTIVHHIYISVK